MTTPKIIQIAVEGATTDTDTTLFALSDDGRIFMKRKCGYQGKLLEAQREQPWQQIEPIPFESWEK